MYKREKNIKVLIIWRGPSPYRVDFFNELGKLCDLTVLFERRPDQITDKVFITIEQPKLIRNIRV